MRISLAYLDVEDFIIKLVLSDSQVQIKENEAKRKELEGKKVSVMKRSGVINSFYILTSFE